MRKRYIGIVGTGSYLPEKIVTNRDLERTLNTSDEWIYTKVGVKARRIAAADEATSDLGAKAAIRAMRDARISPSDIDLIILATSSPDMIQPSTACIVQSKIGTYKAAAFDMSAVCSGSIYALGTAVDIMRGNQRYNTVLVIAAETYSRILDWSDRTTCVYFGDGAGAAILRDVKDGYGLLTSSLKADGRGWNIITFLGGGSRHPATHETINDELHRFQMKSKEVWNFAVTVCPNIVREVLAESALEIQDIDFLISHQANINIIKNVMTALGLPMEKTYTNIEKFANISGASVLIALDEALKLKKIKPEDIVVLVGFGGGLTWGASLWRWQNKEK